MLMKGKVLMMAQSARVIEKEIDRRKEVQAAFRSRADVDEINRRIEAHDNGETEMHSREEAKTMLEKMGYLG